MPAIANIQILLTGVIVILTSLLVFVGIQVILIMRELHRIAKNLNGTSDFSSLGLLGNLTKNFFNLAQHINGDSDIEFAQKEEVIKGDNDKSQEESFTHIRALQERGRRVFYREGKPLG